MVNCAFLPALDFLFRPKAFMFLPMGSGNISAYGHTRYETGGGAEVALELDISSIWPNPLGFGYTVGIEGGMTSNAIAIQGEEVKKNLAIYSLGGVVGLYYFPFSRVFMRADGTVGLFIPTLDKLNGPTSLFWRGGGELGFRFTPSFLIAANAAWRQYGTSDPFNSGLSAGITAQLTMQMGSGSGNNGAEGILLQSDPLYPAFMQLYQTNPVGTLVIRNKENAEIRNVRVSFKANVYTSSEFSCGSVSSIPKGRSVELPLLADFSPAVLRFTDTGRILGEVVIRYNFLGQEREALSSVTLSCHNRNTIPQSDLAELGAFISPTSPETLDYSKYVVGLARARRRTGHNQNMQFAVWLFEGMRVFGIRVGETYAKENEVQFPAETLSFKTGSSCDLAILYAASLEGVGISSALLNVGTDYIVAINLSMSPAAAETLFSSNERILNINNEIWLPVAMSAFNDGFMASWTRAVVSLKQVFEKRGEAADFIMTKDAWASYPPAPLPELGTRLVRIESDPIIAGADNALTQYIDQEIMPLVWRTEAEIRSAPTAALYNRLGILLARAGRINEAKANYERAAGLGSVAAMTNRASLSLIERDYNTAERWFKQALSVDSKNSAAIRGLERLEGRR